MLYASLAHHKGALMASMSQISIVGKARPFTTSFSEICTCCGMMSSSTMPMTRTECRRSNQQGTRCSSPSSAPQSSSLASMRSIRFFTCFHSFLNIKAGDGVIPFPLLQLFVAMRTFYQPATMSLSLAGRRYALDVLNVLAFTSSSVMVSTSSSMVSFSHSTISSSARILSYSSSARQPLRRQYLCEP